MRIMRTYLSELVKRGIGRIVGDEELHAIVGNLDCCGAVHVGETALKNNYNTKILQKVIFFGSEVSKKLLGDLFIQGKVE